MDDIDRKIIGALQDDFALEARPFEIIAKKAGVEVGEVFSRVRRLMDEGTIRRFGASLDSRKLGYSSTLCAVRVKADDVERAADMIGGYSEVTHSYLRENEYNIWFTLIAVDKERIEGILEEIRDGLGLRGEDVLNLPVLRLFKLDARFKAQT